MKKMMMMAAVVVCAVSVQAATFSWTASGLKTALPNNAMSASALVGAIVYAFEDTGTTRAGALAALAGGSATFNTWMAALDPASQSIGGKLTTAAGTISSGQVGNFAAGTSHSLFMVAFDAASVGVAKNYLISANFTKSQLVTGNQVWAFGSPNGTYVPATWTDMVPEPTSMALLALGAAALGLRRKNCK